MTSLRSEATARQGQQITMPVAAVQFLRLLATRPCELRRDGTCKMRGGQESTWCWPCRAQLAIRGWNAATQEGWQLAPRGSFADKGKLLVWIPSDAGKTGKASQLFAGGTR